jgi:hypothetical protein
MIHQEFQHHVKRLYDINKNKRSFIDDVKCTSGFSMDLSFNLLPQLTEEYRNRHELSLSDYKKIFKYTDVNNLWLMSIYNGLEVMPSASGSYGETISSSSGSDITTHGGNAQFKNKLEKFLSTKSLSSEDRLIVKRDDHRPPLPLHFVTSDVLESLSLSKKNYHAVLYKWKDVYLLPYGYYNGYLKMTVVLPRHIYEKRYSKPKNLISQPFEYLVDGVVWVSTVEYILLQTVENHKEINELSSNIDIKSLQSSLYGKKSSIL